MNHKKNNCKMKNIKLILLVTAFVSVFTACDTLLDPGVDNNRDISILLNNPASYEGLLLNVYASIPSSYNFDLDAATDDAVTNISNSSYKRMASDGWLSNSSPVTKWSNYNSIYTINLFLENLDEVIWTPAVKLSALDNQNFKKFHTQRMRGEAYALRAYLQFQLLQAHSGLSNSDELLGFPIITKTLKPSDDLKIPRSSFDLCVTQISNDCDSAIKYLPFIYKDSINNATTTNYVYNITLGKAYSNRINGSIAKTIQAKTLLYAASPAYNPTNSEVRWQNAALKAGNLLKELGNNALAPSPAGHLFYTKVYTSTDVATECIWRRDRSTNQSTYEKNNFPPSKNGNGNINPTQNLVDAFPDANGYPISQSTLYSSANPYASRDPRLTEYIVYNQNPKRLISTYEGAPSDGINASSFATRTGYYLRKFVMEPVTIVGTSITGVERFHTIFRHTDLMLMYAEAANEAYGPDGKPNGISFSARDIIRTIRLRAGILDQTYVNSILSKEDFRKLIQNERRIELCFEGERFWDIRRWKLINEMTQPAKGMLVTTPDAGLTFTYTEIPAVENRMYLPHMIYGPIPYSETLKYNIQQNKGW